MPKATGKALLQLPVSAVLLGGTDFVGKGPTWIDQTWFAYAGLRGGLLWVWGLDAEPICCTMGADD